MASRAFPSLISSAEVALASEDPDQRTKFFTELAESSEKQNILYSGLQLENPNYEDVDRVLEVILAWRRLSPSSSSDSSEPSIKRHLALQYLPSLLTAYLITRLRQRRRGTTSGDSNISFERTEAGLLALYNASAVDAGGQRKASSYRTHPLAYGSIFHDGSRLEPLGALSNNVGPPAIAVVPSTENSAALAGLGEYLVFSQLTFSGYPQVDVITSGNRSLVVEGLLRAYNDVLGDLPKHALDQFVKAAGKLLPLGGSSAALTANGERLPRVQISPAALLELLYASYFCIYNGFQPGGTKIVEMIRGRAAASACPSVMVAANAVRTLTLSSGPKQSGAMGSGSVTTPKMVVDKMITNASFRAKKIGEDIPKIIDPEAEAKSSNKERKEMEVLAQRLLSEGEEKSKTLNPEKGSGSGMNAITEVEENGVAGVSNGNSEKSTPMKDKSHKEGKEESHKQSAKDKLKVKLPNIHMPNRKQKASAERQSESSNNEEDKVNKDALTASVSADPSSLSSAEVIVTKTKADKKMSFDFDRGHVHLKIGKSSGDSGNKEEKRKLKAEKKEKAKAAAAAAASNAAATNGEAEEAKNSRLQNLAESKLEPATAPPVLANSEQPLVFPENNHSAVTTTTSSVLPPLRRVPQDETLTIPSPDSGSTLIL